MEFLSCEYAGRCSGCDWLDLPYDEQRRRKIRDLEAQWSKFLTLGPIRDVRWVAIRNGGLRSRADFTIETLGDGQVVGLYRREDHRLIDLATCAQLTPPLQNWLSDFRSIKFNIKRGSIRLRVSPTGQRGIWLDLANLDVKNLLEDRRSLDAARAVSIVEIGQRRKRLVERNGALKLEDPVLEPWFETYGADGRVMPLHCTIGTFTQPGPEANRALVNEVTQMVRPLAPRAVAEFGSGIGNFTLPLATLASEVRAFEIDALALLGMERSLREQGLHSRVEIFSGNYQVSRQEPPPLDGLDLILVDPPRSGLMKFLEPIAALELKRRPRSFIYVSCFAESFAADSLRLHELGYRLQDIAIVDQFPQSRHYEIVARFDL